MIGGKKKRISSHSAKAKGRELQKWVCAQIARITGFAWGSNGGDKPIESRPMGQSGADVRMEAQVKALFPFSVECKNQQKWSILSWIQQAQKNTEDGCDWLLVVKKNRMSPIVIMDAEKFFDIYSQVIQNKVSGK